EEVHWRAINKFLASRSNYNSGFSSTHLVFNRLPLLNKFLLFFDKSTSIFVVSNQSKNLVMRNTERLLAIMNVLAWIAFIGLMIKAGAILNSCLVSIWNAEGSTNLY